MVGNISQLELDHSCDQGRTIIKVAGYGQVSWSCIDKNPLRQTIGKITDLIRILGVDTLEELCRVLAAEGTRREAAKNLSVVEIDRIVGFLGYGNPAASVWFVGFEEGLGDMNSIDALKNLKARAKFDDTMDLYEAHLRLQEGCRPIDFEKKIPHTPVWKFMAKIMLAHKGQQNWTDTKAANEYIRTRLGRADGDTFMTELSPIPSGSTGDKSWMKKFSMLDPALDAKIKERRKALKALLGDRTQLVICYGKRADDFANLFGITWKQLFSGVSASSDYRFLLLPFFGVGQISHALIGEVAKSGYLNKNRSR